MQTEPLSGSKLWAVGWGYNEKHANNISRLSATNRSVHLQTGSDLGGRLSPPKAGLTRSTLKTDDENYSQFE